MQIIATTVGNSNVTLRIHVADTWWLRMRGLLGRPSPSPGEGLLITRCKAVHTLGMAYPIDVVYLDRDQLVVGIAHSAQPGCFKVRRPGGQRVAHVLELRDGEASRLGLRTGLPLIPWPFIESALDQRLDRFIESACDQDASYFHARNKTGLIGAAARFARRR